MESEIPSRRSRRERAALIRLSSVVVAFLALAIAGLFVVRWFDVRGGGGYGFWGGGSFAIDLRTVRLNGCHESGQLYAVCTQSLETVPRGAWMSSSLSSETWYPTLALVTFWMNVAFGFLVLFQTGARLLTEEASRPLTKLGWIVGTVAAAFAGVTGYVVIPNIDSAVLVERTWTPALLVAADVVGCFALYVATRVRPDDDERAHDAELVASVSIPQARALS